MEDTNTHKNIITENIILNRNNFDTKLPPWHWSNYKNTPAIVAVLQQVNNYNVYHIKLTYLQRNEVSKQLRQQQQQQQQPQYSLVFW